MSDLIAAGHRLEYKWIRPAKERPDPRSLVFLHEGLGSTAMWRNFPDTVVQATGCPALVYSRHGYGTSDRLAAPRATNYMHREALDVLPEILAKLDVSQPILIGHSDGASIALIHAGGGHAVRALVLIAPHVFVEDVTLQSIAGAQAAFEKTDLRVRLGRYHDHVESMFRGWNDIWLDPQFRDWNIETYLPNISASVLLIQGENDQYGTIEQVRAIERQVKAPVETCILPNCGHSPQVDHPDATTSAIAAFVARVTFQAGAAKVPTSGH